MNKTKLKAFLPYLLFIICAVVLLVKAFYSFCWSDETFYFATADRFLKGDSIFKNDWFPTQLSAIMLLPIYTLFVKISGSVSGVILFFRILYVIFELISTIVVYRIIFKTGHRKFLAFAAALCTMFYTHLNIATLSYYTLSVHCFLLSLLIVYYYYKVHKKGLLIIAGVIFALSVLALPTMALAYIVIVIGCLILQLVCSKGFAKLSKDNTLKTFADFVNRAEIITIFLYSLIGIIIPAVIFFAFLLTNVAIKDFIAAIPYVLTDEEHITSLIYPLKKFFIGINEIYGYSAYAGYVFILLTFVFQKLLRKKTLVHFVLCIDILLFIAYAYYSLGCTGYIQTALCMFALPIFFITEHKDYKIFFLLFASGMIFSLVYSYSSNGYLYILSMGHFIASIASIIFINDFLNEIEDYKINTILVAILCSAIVFACGMTVTLRLVNVYRDSAMKNLTVKITQGPAAGLFTTQQHANMYDEVYNTITTLCMKDNDSQNNIFIAKLLPWGYMCTDLKCASPTTWRTGFNSVRLEPYYEMNPDRYPDKVLLLNDEYGCYDTCGDVVADPIPNFNEELNGYLLDYVTENNFKKISVPCGTLYVR